MHAVLPPSKTRHVNFSTCSDTPNPRQTDSVEMSSCNYAGSRAYMLRNNTWRLRSFNKSDGLFFFSLLTSVSDSCRQGCKWEAEHQLLVMLVILVEMDSVDTHSALEYRLWRQEPATFQGPTLNNVRKNEEKYWCVPTGHSSGFYCMTARSSLSGLHCMCPEVPTA